MNSKKIKKCCNILVLIMTIGSVVMLLKFSDLPNFFNINFFNKPENVSNIQMSLYTSFVVPAVFYFLMNYIPDKIKEKEEIEISLPYRCNMHRDIQLFLSDSLSMWSNIYKAAAKKDKSIAITEIKCMQELFEEELFTHVISSIRVFETSNMMGANYKYLLWAQVLPSDLNKIIKQGNDILNKYSRDVPPNIYYAIHYLITQSPIISILSNVIEIFIQQGDKELTLASLIPIDMSSKKMELEKTIKSFDDIYNWVNCEYDRLNKIIDEDNKGNIFQVNISTYLK